VAKLSQVEKAIEKLQGDIDAHHRDIAALEMAIKALRQEKPVRKPRVVKVEQAG